MTNKTSSLGRQYDITGKTITWHPESWDDEPALRDIHLPLRMKVGQLRSLASAVGGEANIMRSNDTIVKAIDMIAPGHLAIMDEMDANDLQDMFMTWLSEYNSLTGQQESQGDQSPQGQTDAAELQNQIGAIGLTGPQDQTGAVSVAITGDGTGMADFDSSGAVSVPLTMANAAIGLPCEIKRGTDLNNLTAPGFYYCPRSATAATLINCPTGDSFSMLVEQHVGVSQKIKTYRNTAQARCYERNYYHTWQPWIATTLGSTLVAIGQGLNKSPTIDRPLDALAIAPTGLLLAIGPGAMGKIEQANTGIAIGYAAMGNSTITRDNIAIGDTCLRNVQADTPDYDASKPNGTRNVAIGANAGLFIHKGRQTVSIGRNANQAFTNGAGPVAIGNNALSSSCPYGLSGAQTGSVENPFAWGDDAGTYLTTAVGYCTAQLCQVDAITAIGGGALRNMKKGARNTAVGANALQSLEFSLGPGGGDLTTLGLAGTYIFDADTMVLTITTSEDHGLAVGMLATIQVTSGALEMTGQGVYRVAKVISAETFTIDAPDGTPTTGTLCGYVTVVSRETATTTWARDDNTAVGAYALRNADQALRSVAVGSGALQKATRVTNSTAIGMYALYSAATDVNSTAVGYSAASLMTAPNQVTALGSQSLRKAQDGSDIVAQAWTNITGVGYDTRVSGANQVQLGNLATQVYAYGNAVNFRADARDKYDVRDTVLGLGFITALRPVDFKWDCRESRDDPDHKPGKRYHHGVIAQDIAALIEAGAIDDFGGYQDHKVNGGNDVLTVGYTEFIGPLIRAVQELSAKVDDLSERLNNA
ncbi:MAG: tail fiber domain-containing protein [Propionibacteriaceae bacterium]|jgi:hypothetical protein|nr:tail fiber domain-containing protein [Propionibacteriaceae bacterium]